MTDNSVCQVCEGDGWTYDDDGNDKDCLNCGGTGRVIRTEPMEQ